MSGMISDTQYVENSNVSVRLLLLLLLSQVTVSHGDRSFLSTLFVSYYASGIVFNVYLMSDIISPDTI
jgi:hypothetical protein